MPANFTHDLCKDGLLAQEYKCAFTSLVHEDIGG